MVEVKSIVVQLHSYQFSIAQKGLLFPLKTSFRLSRQAIHRKSNHCAKGACHINMFKKQLPIKKNTRKSKINWVILLGEITQFG
jgi:hypothetical protein